MKLALPPLKIVFFGFSGFEDFFQLSEKVDQHLIFDNKSIINTKIAFLKNWEHHLLDIHGDTPLQIAILVILIKTFDRTAF